MVDGGGGVLVSFAQSAEWCALLFGDTMLAFAAGVALMDVVVQGSQRTAVYAGGLILTSGILSSLLMFKVVGGVT